MLRTSGHLVLRSFSGFETLQQHSEMSHIGIAASSPRFSHGAALPDHGGSHFHPYPGEVLADTVSAKLPESPFKTARICACPLAKPPDRMCRGGLRLHDIPRCPCSLEFAGADGVGLSHGTARNEPGAASNLAAPGRNPLPSGPYLFTMVSDFQ